MTRLALLRHGHTDWNRAGRIQGRSDIPLDETARQELTAQALPDGWAAAELWSSPLARAFETAKLVAGRAPYTTPALIEMNWGDWEGQHGADLVAQPDSGYRPIEDWGWGFRPPGGESPAEVWTRLAPWLNSLQRDAVAVCHIGIMRVILARAHGWDFDGLAPFRIKRNRIYIVDLERMQAEADPVRLIRREGTT